ncbi:MAG: hypothetical protein ABII09_06115 [Planctomycetota bacterium]
MADAKEKVEAELENIERVLADLPSPDSIKQLSSLELAGVAALIHNFYNGVENVFKQLVISKGLSIPQGPSWHIDLIGICVANRIISQTTSDMLKEYLSFWHFFSHAYSFDVDEERIAPLLERIKDVHKNLVRDISKALPKK